MKSFDESRNPSGRRFAMASSRMFFSVVQKSVFQMMRDRIDARVEQRAAQIGDLLDRGILRHQSAVRVQQEVLPIAVTCSAT